MRLNEVQTLFSQTMLSTAGAVEHPAQHLSDLFSMPEKILPERLKIYRNNIFSSLIGTLLDSYPVIVELTGEDFTKSLIRAFILDNPPQEACLSRYGGALATFIESFAPAKTLPYLPDVARLEWAMNESYYAPDDSPLTLADLQNMPPEILADMALPLRSSSRFLTSNWPLIALHDFCIKEGREESETLNLHQGGCHLMVYRPALTAEIVPLEAAEYTFLLNMGAKKSLGDTLEITLRSFPDFDFQACLQKHIALETFADLPANT